MARENLLVLGLVNGVVSALLFAASLLVVAVLLVAMIVAGCLGAASVAKRGGFAPAADPAWLVRLAFAAALALPWAAGAGLMRTAAKA